MYCPSFLDSLRATLALLPRGRAWQTEAGGPRALFQSAFQPSAFQNNAFATTRQEASVIWKFWAAFATVRNYLETRLCDLRLEFWCATQRETRDLWMAEYGLPDPCDPFPDLCVKVSALGAQTCDYISTICAGHGWAVTCDDFNLTCGSRAGLGQAGCAQVGDRMANQLIINILLSDSPAFGGLAQTPALAGLTRAGLPLSCAPDIGPLQCVVERIAPAHVSVVYHTH